MWSSSSCPKFSPDEIKKATNDFDESKVVGKGGEGKVYLAHLSLQTAVAVKQLNSNSNEFQSEIQTISKIRHPNIVSLLGYCEESTRKILIYEYMAKGSLSDYVQGGQKSKYVSWLQRLHICLDAARGLRHLHAETAQHPKGIIHRDIKPGNILIDDNWVGKIADFGMVKLSDPDQIKSTMSTQLRGTPGFFAPEYIEHQRVTRKIDVYAFGVVLFLLLCRKMPWDQGDDQSYDARKVVDFGQWAEQNIDHQIKGEIFEDSSKVFADIIRRCLLKNPAERPTMNEVVRDLEKALNIQRNLGNLLQQPAEEGAKRLHAAVTVFRPMDPRSYFPTGQEGSLYHAFVTCRYQTKDSFSVPLRQALEYAGFRTFMIYAPNGKRDGNFYKDKFEAIENSMCAVVIFTEYHTGSSDNLEELQRIVDRAKTSNFKIVPIYYEVDPADIKDLNEFHREELEGLRKENKKEDVDTWRIAIQDFAKYKPIYMSGDPDVDKIVDIVREEFSHFPILNPRFISMR